MVRLVLQKKYKRLAINILFTTLSICLVSHWTGRRELSFPANGTSDNVSFAISEEDTKAG
jgi:hypothetical protein